MHDVIGILGAESTGKSTLAAVLVARLTQDTGQSWQLVPEYLRSWCLARGRTPRPHEQWAIAAEQTRQIASARLRGPVVADTTACMTAAYSELLFGDNTLWPMALAAGAGQTLLLTSNTLPWVADGFLRDGAHLRPAVRDLLLKHLGQRAHQIQPTTDDSALTRITDLVLFGHKTVK